MSLGKKPLIAAVETMEECEDDQAAKKLGAAKPVATVKPISKSSATAPAASATGSTQLAGLIDIRLDSPEMSSDCRTTEEEIRNYGSTADTSPLQQGTKNSHFNADVQVISGEPSAGNTDNEHTDGSAISNQSATINLNTTYDTTPIVDRLKCPSELFNKDVESVCTGYSEDPNRARFDPKKSCWWKHPKVKENWRVFFAAFGLLIVGTGLIAVGITVTLLPQIDFQSYVFYIAGVICFIPGVYHVVYVYCAVKGKKGYDFYQLPLFN